jgi:hypothetical protein
VAELLSDVPDDVDIWKRPELIARDSDLWRLWNLLQTACWPNPVAGNYMGRTKISKLMAAKRPRLVPMFDSVVSGLFPPVPDHWQAFYRVTDDRQLRRELSIAAGRGAPDGAGFLRRVDALLWMIGHEPAW